MNCEIGRSVTLLAERKGFEPLMGYKPIHDFQSCALDQLSHLSSYSAGKTSYPTIIKISHGGVNTILLLLCLSRG